MSAKKDLLDGLCLRWNAPSPQLALREALALSFANLQEVVPPINVAWLAKLRNVVKISQQALSCDGFISVIGEGRYSIEVNKDHPETRQRFTIAHELGHTFFFEVEGRRRERLIDGDLDAAARFDPEEALCNWAAAEILMPQRQFRSAKQAVGLSSASLVRLSRIFNVSVRAIARRLVQNCGFGLVIIEWECSPNCDQYVSNWLVTSFGAHRGISDTLVVRTDDPAFKFFHESAAFRGEVWISLGGPRDGYFVDTYARLLGQRRRLVTIFVLDRNPASILSPGSVPDNDECQLALF